jgi:hypothetical protein
MCIFYVANSPIFASSIVPKGVELRLEDARIFAVVADLLQFLLNRAGQQFLSLDFGHLQQRRGRRKEGRGKRINRVRASPRARNGPA